MINIDMFDNECATGAPPADDGITYRQFRAEVLAQCRERWSDIRGGERVLSH